MWFDYVYCVRVIKHTMCLKIVTLYINSSDEIPDLFSDKVYDNPVICNSNEDCFNKINLGSKTKCSNGQNACFKVINSTVGKYC